MTDPEDFDITMRPAVVDSLGKDFAEAIIEHGATLGESACALVGAIGTFYEDGVLDE